MCLYILHVHIEGLSTVKQTNIMWLGLTSVIGVRCTEVRFGQFPFLWIYYCHSSQSTVQVHIYYRLSVPAVIRLCLYSSWSKWSFFNPALWKSKTKDMLSLKQLSYLHHEPYILSATFKHKKLCLYVILWAKQDWKTFSP